MKRGSILASAALGMALCACGKAAPDTAADAGKTAAALRGDAGSAADNPQCRMFTAAELAAYLGEPVGAGTNAAGGTGCQWPASGSDGFVQIQVVPADQLVAPSLAPGYKKLPAAGDKGFAAPNHDGWDAGAVKGANAAEVSLVGAKASEANAEKLLRETLKRMPG